MSAYALLATAVVVPIAVNPTLRSGYIGLVAHWRAKLAEPPRYVFLGDSITAGGMVWGWRLGYDPLAAINLGESGLLTWQIVDRAIISRVEHTCKYRHHNGTNDAIHAVNPDELNAEWDRFFSIIGDTPVIVTLPPMTANAEFNEHIREIDAIVRVAAQAHSAKIIDLNHDVAPSGTIQERYTVDGVHFTNAAYAIWAAKIKGN